MRRATLRTGDVDEIEEFEELRSAVREVGEERAEETREAYEALDEALEEYRDEATGTGDFRKYIEFRNVVMAIDDSLDEGDNVHLRDDFERRTRRSSVKTARVSLPQS